MLQRGYHQQYQRWQAGFLGFAVCLILVLATLALSNSDVEANAAQDNRYIEAAPQQVGRGQPAYYNPNHELPATALDTPTSITSPANTAGSRQVRTTQRLGPLETPTVTAIPDFQDVPSSNTFYSFLHNIYLAGIVTGYPCGGLNEPCVPPYNLSYYRPSNNVTRAQMSKFVDLARHNPGIAISTISNPLPLTADSDAPAGTGLYGTTAGNGTGRSIDQVNAGVAGYAFGAGGPDGGSIGVIGYSSNDNGAWIATGSLSNTYGLYVSQGGALLDRGPSTISNTLYVNGPLVVTGPKTGYVTDIVRNTGGTVLHPGDVVTVQSAADGPTQLGEIPVPGVGAAQGAYDTGVLGVVDMRWIPADPTAPQGTAARTGGYDQLATVIHPGEYMGIVTLGLYKAVRVDASSGPIHVGDLLTTSATPGVAVKATDKVAAIGAIIGKAMGELERGSGMISVMVTLK